MNRSFDASWRSSIVPTFRRRCRKPPPKNRAIEDDLAALGVAGRHASAPIWRYGSQAAVAIGSCKNHAIGGSRACNRQAEAGSQTPRPFVGISTEVEKSLVVRQPLSAVFHERFLDSGCGRFEMTAVVPQNCRESS
jgi:hypothetical protein